MKYVLFVCTQNAGRSQIAEALFNRLAPDDVRAESAGQHPRTEGIWPAVIEVVRELRIDILLEHRLDAIRRDRTAHQLRLVRILPALIGRFPQLPDAEVRACADA